VIRKYARPYRSAVAQEKKALRVDVTLRERQTRGARENTGSEVAVKGADL
jgi:hypothetical protein